MSEYEYDSIAQQIGQRVYAVCNHGGASSKYPGYYLEHGKDDVYYGSDYRYSPYFFFSADHAFKINPDVSVKLQIHLREWCRFHEKLLDLCTETT